MSRRSQSGNVFFALLAAVGLVGVLGASLTTFITGPAATMVTVTNKSKADTQMQIATRLAVVEAVHQGSGGDCDDDGTIEPLPPQDAGGSPAPLGGGHLPAALGAAQLDPWGTPYGYCAWNHGALNADNGCSANLLAGTNYPDARTRTALAIISAGPDRRFDTMCGPHPVYVDRNGDDLVMAYTYAEAIEASGGLWVLKSGEPSTATINRDVEVQGAFRMGIAGETQGTVGAGACTSPEHINRMRYNSFDEKIEVCSFVSPDYVWRPISSLELWALHGNQQDIFYTGGNVGIGTTSPAAKLHIDQNNSVSDSSLLEDYALVLNKPENSVGVRTGLAFHASTIVEGRVPGAAIVLERLGGNGAQSRGNLHFQTRTGTGGLSPLATRMMITPAGDVGIGTAHPSVARLTVAGKAQALALVGNDHSYLSYFPLGIDASQPRSNRKAWIGFATAGSTTFSISNEYSTGGLAFRTRTGTGHLSPLATRMMITPAGDVGIGTTSPAAKLHINQNDSVADDSLLEDYALVLNKPENSVGVRTGLAFHASTVVEGRVPGAAIVLERLGGTGAQSRGNLHFQTRTGTGDLSPLATRMMITPAGDVGIGTTPTRLLHLKRAGGVDLMLEHETSDAALHLRIDANGDAFIGNKNTFVGQSFSGGRNLSLMGQEAISFRYGDDGTSGTEAMRITSDGNVGIGKKLHVNGTIQVPGMWLGKSSNVGVAPDIHMNAQGLIAADSTLHLMADGDGSGNGDIMFRAGALITPGSDLLVRIMRNGDTIIYGSGTTCTIGNSTGATMCSSDARLKQDVETVSDALENISSLRGVRFRWNDTARFEDKDKHHLGFIAQEIKEIFPEAVEEDEEGFLMVASGALIPPLVEAVKELKVLFDRLMKKLEALFDRVNMLALHNDRQDAIIAEQAAIIAGLETANRDVLYRLEKLEAAYPESCH